MGIVQRISIRVKNALLHITKPNQGSSEADESVTKPETPED